MKKNLKISFLSLLALACHSAVQGQTIEWASEPFTEFRQSNGDPMDSSFLFELGIFDNSFVPDDGNLNDWSNNWIVFDKADFNIDLGYLTSSADMNATGGSKSPDGNPNYDFQGLPAYIWMRNQDLPSETSEWYLAEDPTWIFPTAVAPVDGEDDCCNTSTPVQWSFSGPIDFEQVPEPTTPLLLLISSALVAVRRKRS